MGVGGCGVAAGSCTPMGQAVAGEGVIGFFLCDELFEHLAGAFFFWVGHLGRPRIIRVPPAEVQHCAGARGSNEAEKPRESRAGNQADGKAGKRVRVQR